MIGTVVALVADARNHVWVDKRITDDALAIALVAKTADGNARLLAAENEVGTVSCETRLAKVEEARSTAWARVQGHDADAQGTGVPRAITVLNGANASPLLHAGRAPKAHVRHTSFAHCAVAGERVPTARSWGGHESTDERKRN